MHSRLHRNKVKWHDVKEDVQLIYKELGQNIDGLLDNREKNQNYLI